MSAGVANLVKDYGLWRTYSPILDEIEAVLLKHGIDVSAMGRSATPDPLVVKIQAALGVKTDGIMGPVTIAAIAADLGLK